MNENPYNNISPQNEKMFISKSEKGMSRRTLLGGLAAASALALIGKPLVDSLTTEKDDDFSTENNSTEALTEEERLLLQQKLEEIANRIKPTEQQHNIERADTVAIGKTFKQQVESGDEINLNAETRRALYEHWQHEYRKGHINYKDGIVDGLTRMAPWFSEIQEIFAKYDIPPQYVYLAIAESHFNMDAVSDKAAVGPYQIIPKTARDYNLIMTSIYDERRDPIKSAELCARHLRDSYETFGHDWRLALMDYNGGYTNTYLKEIIEDELLLKEEDIQAQKDEDGSDLVFALPENGTLGHVAIKFNTTITRLKIINDIKDADVRNLKPGAKLLIPEGRTITFDNFNKWLENSINQAISDKITQQEHIIMPGEMLGTIAKQYDVDYHEIKKLNNLTSNTIIHGKKLKIPSPNSKNRLKIILNLVSSYKENINYPEKLLAINDIIKRDNLSQTLENSKKDYREMKVPKTRLATLQKYIIQRGDIFSDIIQAYKNRYPKYTAFNPNFAELIKEQNNISDEGEIRAGQKIKLELPISKPPTLSNIAKQYKYNIEQLTQLNPAVIDKDIQLHEQMLLRVPL